jgi:hypothetical protein
VTDGELNWRLGWLKSGLRIRNRTFDEQLLGLYGSVWVLRWFIQGHGGPILLLLRHICRLIKAVVIKVLKIERHLIWLTLTLHQLWFVLG